jgi:hypothetical protein
MPVRFNGRFELVHRHRLIRSRRRGAAGKSYSPLSRSTAGQVGTDALPACPNETGIMPGPRVLYHE